ncbi:MAG TPA: helix-turn-helix transcriptional regulator [Ktedonobacterales bacterium]|nr:helix-turn-helix transcriptional regulator [Ktedonobacterales bacterium]
MKKGSLELLVLHLLYERPSYGYEICERLRERSDGTLRFEEGAVYPLLHTLEREGLAEGYWEDSAPPPPSGDAAVATSEDQPADTTRKGPRRRYYRLTPAGVEALRAAVQAWRRFTGAVGRVLGEAARGEASLRGEVA